MPREQLIAGGILGGVVVSILYLRCGWFPRPEEDYVQGAVSILYLRCEKLDVPRGVGWSLIGFNSLFEMHPVLHAVEDPVERAVSILYLRCSNILRFSTASTAWCLVSILYLRCRLSTS